MKDHIDRINQSLERVDRLIKELRMLEQWEREVSTMDNRKQIEERRKKNEKVLRDYNIRRKTVPPPSRIPLPKDSIFWQPEAPKELPDNVIPLRRKNNS